jgi:hypothetical protein
MSIRYVARVVGDAGVLVARYRADGSIALPDASPEATATDGHDEAPRDDRP